MGFFRKLLRRTFYTAAALSTLLLLATLILWPVSYNRGVLATYTIERKTCFGLLAIDGRLWLYTHNLPAEVGLNIIASKSLRVRKDPWAYLSWNADTAGFPEARTSLGITMAHVSWFDVEARHLAIPFSYLVLLFAILPLLAFRSIRRQRKLARVGLCSKCRYDLRAHAIGENCPECGTAKKG